MARVQYGVLFASLNVDLRCNIIIVALCITLCYIGPLRIHWRGHHRKFLALIDVALALTEMIMIDKECRVSRQFCVFWKVSSIYCML